MVWSLQLALLLVACRQGTTGTATPTTAPTAAVVSATRDVAATTAAPALPTPAPTNPPPTEPPTPTAEPTPAATATRPPLGTAERPVQLLFPPVAVGAVIMQRAAPLVEALRAATGAEFTVGILDSEAAVVEMLCGAPEDTIGFVSAAAYTIAHEECDAQAGLVAVQEDGFTWQMGMLVVRPGEAGELADLDGQRWAVADTRSLPDYLYFRALLAAAGIEPGELLTAPEESSALLALTSNEADFTTAQYVPPIMPQGRAWFYGESEAEEWRLLGVSPSRSPIGYVIVAAEPELGGYRLRDARARLFDTTPDIFDATRILGLSEPIPNETIVLGADFPPELARPTLETLTAFAASDACGASLCSADFLGWAGLETADDAAYDPIRTIKDTLDLEAADLWAELD